MKNVIKVISCSFLAMLLSAEGFSALNFSVTGDSVFSGKQNGTSYTSQGVSLFTEYQMMQEWPLALGLMGSFHNRATGAQSEVAPTMKLWLGSDITGVAALEPYARVGYAFSWVNQANGAKAHTNNGFVMNLGNAFAISETVSALAAYTFNARTYNNGNNSSAASSHGVSLGFSADLF